MLPFAPLVAAHPHDKIVRVIDGDTVVVNLQLVGDVWLNDAPLRINGINCPEIDTPEGQSAKEFTAAWIAKGDCKILLEKKRDKYGRLLGDLENDKGRLSAALLKSRHAVEYAE